MSDGFRELLALGYLIYVASMDGCSSPPKDDVMLATFRVEQTRFEELREKMCKFPESQTVLRDSNKPPELISEIEFDWYRKTLVAIGAERAVVVLDPCRLWLDVWGVGSALSSTDAKGYRFGPPLLDEIVELDSLDDLEPSPTAWAITYQRRIEGEWWLEHRHFK